MIQNSEVIRKVLKTLIDISRRKTDEGHAVFVMDSLLKKLGNKYNFLKYVEIKDSRFFEDVDSVSVMSDVNSVPSVELGRAIHEIITTMNKSLGEDAGHFFIKEVYRDIGDDYYSSIKDMGLDLSLLQLEHELDEMGKKLAPARKSD